MIPTLTTDQMIEVDRAMIDEYGILLIQMMENAGRNLAHLARSRFLAGDPRGKRVVVLAGTGGNGGGALVAARRLHNYGASVTVSTTKSTEEAFGPIPAHQLRIVQRMGLPIYMGTQPPSAEIPDLILDGLIGYSLKGDPRGMAAELITWANKQPAPVLALDVPSGLDTTTGTLHTPAISAEATLTLALPKQGLLADQVTSHVGELYLADISVPPALYASPALNLDIGPIFAQSDIIRLRD